MLKILPLLVCIGAGIVGGVFFAFSAFVMKALAQLPAPQGIAVMQRINVVVLNPLFLGVFVGTAVLAGICVLAGFFPWANPGRSCCFLQASHAVGCFGVTVAFNVPRNERLARMGSESSEAAAHWPIYLREWSFWNHVRTVASVVSAVCAAAALAYCAAASRRTAAPIPPPDPTVEAALHRDVSAWFRTRFWLLDLELERGDLGRRPEHLQRRIAQGAVQRQVAARSAVNR